MVDEGGRSKIEAGPTKVNRFVLKFRQADHQKEPEKSKGGGEVREVAADQQQQTSNGDSAPLHPTQPAQPSRGLFFRADFARRATRPGGLRHDIYKVLRVLQVAQGWK